MSSKIPVLTLPIKATGVIAARRFVTVAGAHAAAGAAAIGVSDTSAAIGAVVAVDVLGVSLVEASAAIVAGAAIEAATGGKAVTRTTGVTLARALDAAAADGDFIRIQLIPN